MADSAKKTIIEGVSLPCVRAGRADNLAAVLAEIRPGNLRTASAELTRWLVDTAKEWSPDWWEGAPVDAITGYFEDREVAELDAENFRISLVVLRELLQAIGTAGAPAGWWEEIAAAGDDFDAPGGRDYARSMLQIAAEQGTRLARERDLWRGLAGRQRDAFDRLTRSLVEQTSRASELAGQLLQATAERGPLEAERRALRHLAGFFGVEENPAREIARAHTEALRELAQVSAERDRALARLGEIGEERDRLADELAQFMPGEIDTSALLRYVMTCDPSPPRCDVCRASMFRGRCILNAACDRHDPAALAAAERGASLNLHAAERLLCEQALLKTGSIVEAAKLLGITRHALKRRIIKHRIEMSPRNGGGR